MKLLVVSHPCATPINQDFFARVQVLSGWDMTLVLPALWHNEYGSQRAARWSAFGGRLRPLPVLLPGNIPLHVYAARFSRTITVERPDAIYVHHEPYASATLQVFLAARRFPRVPLGFYSAQNLRKRYPWPFSALERYVYSRADFAFPVSRTVEQVIRSKGYRAVSRILPLGLDTSFYSPAVAPAGDSASGYASRPFTVGFVGRLAPEKGVDLLIEALARIPHVSLRALIVGDGPASAVLRRQAASARVRVGWLGYVDHCRMPDFYRELDLLAVPSRSVPKWTEQFGRVVIEALACGVPVVASDSGELPGLIRSTGGGWVFPENDAGALACLLEALAARPSCLDERARRGREAVVLEYDVDRLAAIFVDVVRSAVRQRSMSLARAAFPQHERG